MEQASSLCFTTKLSEKSLPTMVPRTRLSSNLWSVSECDRQPGVLNGLFPFGISSSRVISFIITFSPKCVFSSFMSSSLVSYLAHLILHISLGPTLGCPSRNNLTVWKLIAACGEPNLSCWPPGRTSYLPRAVTSSVICGSALSFIVFFQGFGFVALTNARCKPLSIPSDLPFISGEGNAP